MGGSLTLSFIFSPKTQAQINPPYFSAFAGKHLFSKTWSQWNPCDLQPCCSKLAGDPVSTQSIRGIYETEISKACLKCCVHCMLLPPELPFSLGRMRRLELFLLSSIVLKALVVDPWGELLLSQLEKSNTGSHWAGRGRRGGRPTQLGGVDRVGVFLAGEKTMV